MTHPGTNPGKARLPASTLRLAVVFGLAAATLTGALAVPAFAEEHGDRGRRGHQHWRGDRDYGGYYRRPGIYYAPPPIVYQPYGYYQQPGASVNLNFPLRF